MRTVSSTPIILPLDDERLTLAVGGGKATNLARMLRARLPVPPGMVLTTAAYKAFVEQNDLNTTIQRTLVSLAGDSALGLEEASATIRDAFEAATLSDQLADAIDQAYMATQRPGCHADPVAVRSSATAEDLLDASFAGQQETYLHVRGLEAVRLAVKRCWGSLWTARAMAYRERQQLSPDDVSLAVIIQAMVPASASGVLFTIHPVTGRADQAVINATWGLGEPLVSGRVSPDMMVVERTHGRIIREEIGEKAFMTVGSESGTKDTPVPPAERARRALSDGQVQAILELGRSLEALFGGPQDVEWAIVDDQPVLLQSRAVTSPGVPGDDAWAPTTRAEPQPFDFWTQQDLGERWPQPITPLTWSVSEPMNQIIMDNMFVDLKAPYAGRIQWSKRAFGRVWLNEGAMLHAFIHGFGMPLAMVQSGLSHPGARPADAEAWKWGRALSHLSYFVKAAGQWEKEVTQFEREFPIIDQWIAEFRKRPLDSEDDKSLLLEAQQTWFPRILHYVAFHTHATSLSMSSYAQLEALLAKWCDDPTAAQTLVGGIAGVVDAEIGPDLAGMANTLRALGLDTIALVHPPGEALAILLASPQAAPFQAQFDRFLSRHGHRCMTEAELLIPRWFEAPEQVMAQLVPYLQHQAGRDGSDAASRREDMTARLTAQLSWWQRPIFRKTLARAHRYTRLRENGQGYVVKLLYPLRHLLAELGKRWADRTWLRAAQDVFFLLQEELQAVTAAGSPEAARIDLQARADARRRAHDYWMVQPAPDALDATGEPVASPVSEENGQTLSGLAASRGCVTGTARVILSPQDAIRLRPGEILVTRATDPGWTPVFAQLGGAVIEIGGLLSHGAIVAREYGLPAVVNVSQATRRILDGQTVTVDGSTGRVTLTPFPRAQGGPSS